VASPVVLAFAEALPKAGHLFHHVFSVTLVHSELNSTVELPDCFPAAF
jgi:hypothetical protein